MQHSSRICVLYGMSAKACEIGQFEKTDVEIAYNEETSFFARGVKPGVERRCPACDSIVYSRRHKLCGVCAEPLPLNCLFSVEQRESIESLISEERQRHRLWLHRFEN